jgi:hypothetical protein
MRFYEIVENFSDIFEAASDNFEIEVRKPWKIFLSKKKMVVPKYTGEKPMFIAQAAHERNPGLVFHAVSDSREQARSELVNKLSKYWEDQKEVNWDLYSPRASIDLNKEFEEFLQPNIPVWIKIGNNGEFPSLTIASREFLTYYIDEMQSQGFKKAHPGRNPAGGGWTLPVSKGDMMKNNLVPFMRYYAKDEGTDQDSNHLIILQEFEKTMGKGDKIRMGTPGITVAAQTIKKI